MAGRGNGWLVIAFTLLAVSAAQEIAECDAPQEPETQAPSMLQAHRIQKQTREVMTESEMMTGSGSNSRASCAPLALSGFVMEGCDNLTVGESCKVSCADGLVGAPVRYFCFSALAAAGEPPAALMAPICRNSSGTPFRQGRQMALSWGVRGCLQCSHAWRPCDLVPDAVPGDARCSIFTIDLANNNRIMKGSQCIDQFGGPKPGLWRCNNGDNQDFFEEVSTEFAGTTELCVQSGRGKTCYGEVGRTLQKAFFDTPINASLMKPAIEALASGDGPAFLKHTYAMQVCRARLESGAPDSFWSWLKTQDYKLIQALFSTFPVHPGHVKIFAQMLELVGAERFQGMASFAVALAWVNRMKESIDSAVFIPDPNMEMNDNGYLRSEMDRIRQEMIDGQHCGIQSNECRNLHTCCGPPESWNFTWPRDPSPSVKEWLEFWLRSVGDHADQLWMNPLKDVPWMYAVYVWPSPVEECEWVHKKLIDGEAIENGGRWYFYDSSFHNRVCAGGPFHPDSLPGIAVYGGVCGRMAQLEWRKTGCMGMPATMKGEPGHCAGYKYVSTTAAFTTLNVITDYSRVSTIKIVPEVNDYVTIEVVEGDQAFPNASATCVYCPSGWRACETRPAGSEECSKFTVDADRKRLWFHRWGQCFDMFSGPRAGIWGRCSNSPNANQDFTTNAAGEMVITSSRGQLRIRATKVPPEPYLDECLACKRSYRGCERVPSNSSDCTHFVFENDTGLIRVPALGQCFDMHGGPTPGLWSCNSGSSNQRASVTPEGYLRVTSSRGQLTMEQFAVAADMSERGRCLACKRSYRDCDFSVAGADDCTVFQYDPVTKMINAGFGNQCLDMKSGPKAGLWTCNTASENMIATVTGTGSLQISGARGQLDLFVPNNGTLPNVTTKWQYQGIHEIECTKGNCHYHSIMGLDSKVMIERRHKEAALAALEAFNDYEHNGLFPTAHDEARLAASVAFALRKEGALDVQELEPLVIWALKRNPALYEAWEVAADLHADGSGLLNASGMPRRDALASRAWYETLSLLRVGTEGKTQSQAADRFAREHLLGQGPWVQFPQLRRSLVGRLCGALSDGVLEELGEASEGCILVRELAQGHGWNESEDLMVAADTQGTGNLPAAPFEAHWEALARLALAPNQGAEVAKSLVDITENLLAYLTVGYINSRSQTFYAEHGRVLLRSPYAHVLQLAAAVLPVKRRMEIFHSTKKMLQQPAGAADRLWEYEDGVTEAFLLWLSSHTATNGTVYQEASASDPLNGGTAGDSPSPEVLDELQLDRDQEVELGAIHWHEAQDRPYDADSLLKTLLRLHGEGENSPESATEGGLGSLLQQTAVNKAEAAAGAAQSELIQMCMDDLMGSA